MSGDLHLDLVRHGETLWTEAYRIHGRLDAPLSEAGIQHAILTAQRLGRETFDALYTSRLGRCQQTAAILGETSHLEPQALDGLEEADYGILEGRSLHLFEPDGTGAHLLRPWVALALLLTGERPPQFQRRVGLAVDELCQRHLSGKLLVVTHWGVLSILMALLLDDDTSRWREYGPWTACGITELKRTDDRWNVIRVNDTEHLHQREAQ
jgi:probable phosphoglycerate mutase